MKYALLIGLVVACGGKQKTSDGDDNGGPSVVGMQDTGDSTDRSGAMIPPEKMDAVQQALHRKGMIMSHCLVEANVKSGTHGSVSLEIVVGTSGKADSVKVNKTSFRSTPGVDDCVVKHVQEIAFPELPKSFETSYTYPMEVN